MARKTFRVLLYGGVATACLGFANYNEKIRANAARMFKRNDFEEDDYIVNSSFPSWDSNWDRRDPYSLVGKVQKENDNKYEEIVQKPTATRHIILIRHGQYNTQGATDADRYLTELGRQQAAATGVRLKELGLDYNHLVHSTMTRAAETATLILKSLPADLKVSTSDLLREGAPIIPDPPVKHWKPESKHFYTDGARIEAAFRKFFHRADTSQKEDSYEVIVCHANVIRYCVCRAMQLPPRAWLRFSLHHCSLTWISIRPSGRVSTYLVGDCGHLPKKLLTTS